MKTYNIIITLILILLTLLYTNTCIINRTYEESNTTLVNTLNDSVSTYKNKLNQNVTRINILEVTNKAQFLKFENLSKENKRLQEIVKKSNPTVAAIIKTEIKYDTIIKTINTVTIDSINYLKLPYSREIKNKWIALNYTIDHDNTTMFISTNDELELIIDREKKGLFKKSIPFAQVTNNNPFSMTKDLRVYNIVEKKHRWVLSAGVTVYPIIDKPSIRIGITPGLTLGYTILKF